MILLLKGRAAYSCIKDSNFQSSKQQLDISPFAVAIGGGFACARAYNAGFIRAFDKNSPEF